MGTQILLVGQGADLDFLAKHLEAAGYAVACASAVDVLDVMHSMRPAEVMITPGVPEWQRRQIRSTLGERYPDVRVVMLRKRDTVPNIKLP